MYLIVIWVLEYLKKELPLSFAFLLLHSYCYHVTDIFCTNCDLYNWWQTLLLLF